MSAGGWLLVLAGIVAAAIIVTWSLTAPAVAP